MASPSEKVLELRRLALSRDNPSLSRWAVESLGELVTADACADLRELSGAYFREEHDYYGSLVKLKLRGNPCVTIAPP